MSNVLQVLSGLFIGNLGDAEDVELLLGNSISHILSVHDCMQCRVDSINYMFVEITDSPSQPLTDVIGECLEFIHRARAAGGECHHLH